MSESLRKKMQSKTAGHCRSFEEALQHANAKARVGAEGAVKELYGVCRDAIPSIPEVTVSESGTAMGLSQLSCRFCRADGERYLTLTPVKYLIPREPFPEREFSCLDPFAVLGMEIRSNSRQVQIGYLTLRLAARTETDLLADEPMVEWKVVHLVKEGASKVDRSLAERLIERAFVHDFWGNA